MQTETFIDDVAAAAVLRDRDKAERIALAVIETACMHLPTKQSRRLAVRLPGSLASAAETGAQHALQSQRDVTAEMFYTQVAQRAELPVEQVHLPARAALRVFRQAVSDDQAMAVIMATPGGLAALLAGMTHAVEPDAIPPVGRASVEPQAAMARPGLSTSAASAPEKNGDP